jgi:hypothetical protein
MENVPVGPSSTSPIPPSNEVGHPSGCEQPTVLQKCFWSSSTRLDLIGSLFICFYESSASEIFGLSHITEVDLANEESSALSFLISKIIDGWVQLTKLKMTRRSFWWLLVREQKKISSLLLTAARHMTNEVNCIFTISNSVMATTTSFRSSFQERCRKEGESPPTKVLRSCGEGSCHASTDSAKRVYTPRDAYHVFTPLRFSLNEFLPLDHAEREERRRSVKLDISQLTDDVLGFCLFGGFLDSFETARLTCVNKRIRRIASKQVQKLDLSRCKKIQKEDVSNIVRLYQNLTVRILLSYPLAPRSENYPATHTFVALHSLLTRISTFHTALVLEARSLTSYYHSRKR